MITINDAIQFVREVRIELTKVTWPSTQEFLGSMLVVFIFVCFFVLYLGSVDLVLNKIAKQLFQYAIYFA